MFEYVAGYLGLLGGMGVAFIGGAFLSHGMGEPLWESILVGILGVCIICVAVTLAVSTAKQGSHDRATSKQG